MQVQTTDFERSCTSPEGLQEEIDKLVAVQCKGRAFVRCVGLLSSIPQHKQL